MTVAELEVRLGGGRELAEWMTLDRMKSKERAESEEMARIMAQTEAAARGR